MSYFNKDECHKGFYNEVRSNKIADALNNIHYEDFFKDPKIEYFPYKTAFFLLYGSCNHFALSLKKILGYTPYIIEDNEGKGFHAFCKVNINEKVYYVDARGMTTSFDEFMIVANDFVQGKYTIREVSQSDIDEWDSYSKYNDEAYAFAEAVIKKYINYYKI